MDAGCKPPNDAKQTVVNDNTPSKNSKHHIKGTSLPPRHPFGPGGPGGKSQRTGRQRGAPRLLSGRAPPAPARIVPKCRK